MRQASKKIYNTFVSYVFHREYVFDIAQNFIGTREKKL